MGSIVLDTHSLIWFLERSSQLSQAASAAIASVLTSNDLLYISSISFAEMLYLEEKRRIVIGTLDRVLNELHRPGTPFEEVPVLSGVVREMRSVPRDVVPDLPDRVIAATSLYMGVPLVTADGDIHHAGIPVIW
jgi:PIN domain nuclease of toxin-antitoxin system